MTTEPSPAGPKSTDFESSLEQASLEVASFNPVAKAPIQHLQHLLHNSPTLVPVFVLLLSILIFGSIAGDRFFHPFNLSLIIQQVSVIGILAAAQSLVILTAGIDLSVAAIMVLSSVLMGKLAVSHGVPVFIAVPLGILLGCLCGFFNGKLVTVLKLPPFIVTLGTWNIFFALNLWYSGAQSIRSQDIDKAAPLLKLFGERFDLFGTKFTYGSVLMIVIFVVLWYVLNRTAWGRHVYAVGDDPEAAELAGIRKDRILVSVYSVAGLICATVSGPALDSSRENLPSAHICAPPAV